MCPSLTGDGDLLDIKYYMRGFDKIHVYNLGLALGLAQQKVRWMRDSDTFLDNVLAAWLRKEDDVKKKGTLSWSTLVKALRHPMLHQDGVASDICKDKQGFIHDFLCWGAETFLGIVNTCV